MAEVAQVAEQLAELVKLGKAAEEDKFNIRWLKLYMMIIAIWLAYFGIYGKYQPAIDAANKKQRDAIENEPEK